jgi:hypothetical protein
VERSSINRRSSSLSMPRLWSGNRALGLSVAGGRSSPPPWSWDALIRMASSAWTSAVRPAGLPTACCSMEPRVCMPWTWDTGNSTGGSVKTPERTNIRYIDAATIPEPVALVVIDVSFISLKKVLPPIVPLLLPEATLIALIKPQFEVGKGQVGRGGIVRDEAQRQMVVRTIVVFAGDLGFRLERTVDSPVKGKKGNREILAIFKYRPPICDMKEGPVVNES